jgi:hypothetical protein
MQHVVVSVTLKPETRATASDDCVRFDCPVGRDQLATAVLDRFHEKVPSTGNDLAVRGIVVMDDNVLVADYSFIDSGIVPHITQRDSMRHL